VDVNEPVLPALAELRHIDIARRDGVRTGDRIELFEPRKKPVEGKSLILPEVSIEMRRFFALRRTVRRRSSRMSTNRNSATYVVRIAAKMPLARDQLNRLGRLT